MAKKFDPFNPQYRVAPIEEHSGIEMPEGEALAALQLDHNWATTRPESVPFSVGEEVQWNTRKFIPGSKVWATNQVSYEKMPHRGFVIGYWVIDELTEFHQQRARMYHGHFPKLVVWDCSRGTIAYRVPPWDDTTKVEK